jgi:hypothetical protein
VVQLGYSGSREEKISRAALEMTSKTIVISNEVRDLNHRRNGLILTGQFSRRRTLTDNKRFDPFGEDLTIV